MTNLIIFLVLGLCFSKFTQNVTLEEMVVKSSICNPNYYYDKEENECIHLIPAYFEVIGEQVNRYPPQRIRIECPLDLDTNDKKLSDFYREILETDVLPSEKILRDAKEERDKKVAAFLAEMETLQTSARRAANKANAEAVRERLKKEAIEEFDQFNKN